MNIAKRISAIVVNYHECLPDGVQVLVVSCADHDRYVSLPQAVEYDGTVYGRTGWNSDRCIAYYRDDARVAFVKG